MLKCNNCPDASGRHNGLNFSASAFLTRMNAVWFSGKITDAQCECLTSFVAAYVFYNNIPGRSIPVSWLAYVLATTYHETAFTMQPIEEYGKGVGRPYGEPDPQTGQVYYGRGYVQLTWHDNYLRGQETVTDFRTLQNNVPLLARPELALEPWVAVQIAINGMSTGWFTGKSLGDYLTDTKTDYVNARRIINGTDKAQTIAAYAEEAEAALRLAHGEGSVRSLVQMGSKGDDVRELQLMLKTDPDGVAGNATISVLADFQRCHRLDADGICGSQTWAVLDRDIYGIN
ncbi:peptidoglycan-binding protein [Klebsiella aerogenes]